MSLSCLLSEIESVRSSSNTLTTSNGDPVTSVLDTLNESSDSTACVGMYSGLRACVWRENVN